ncbi:MAG: hypothetical protein IJ782_06515 [Prevotella sp.]|nr:hypothetical protein [Prevotella sp.]
MNLQKKIARWWQGQGFGIQSRSDYEYLKDVIRESLPYYAYDDIKSDGARLIYRICNHDRKRHVAMVGPFTAEELTAAEKALGSRPERADTLTHLHGRQTVIVGDIRHTGKELWSLALGSPHAITWDMGDKGLIRFVEGRYEEHYCI